MQQCRQSYLLKLFLVRGYSTSKKSVKSIDHLTKELDNFYDSFPLLIQKNNHLYMTQNIQDASLVLMNMYNSLPELDPVKQYLEKYCLHLLP